ncbi:MAG: hypothetical protein IPG10_09940 [Flavobacteriales bacterium]|nr:hypothetical protein [Flavobacteriales bacterium]
MRSPLLLAVLLFSATGHVALGQSLGTRAVVPAGGAGEGGGTSLGWSLGQPASATYAGGGAVVTAGVQQPEGILLTLNISALLDGPYVPAASLMHDSLRTRGLLPANEPFTALGHPPVGLQNGSALGASALLHTGPNAVVDWVFLELRGADDNGRIDAARAAVVQRDGDVVDMDGLSPVRIAALPGNYHIALLHRNHLPVMTLAPVALGGGPNTLDLTDGSTALHVPDAQRVRSGVRLLWVGDVNHNGAVKYAGSNNDRDPILIAVGGTVPTATVNGYLPTDVNLDGRVRYAGSANDRDPVLQTIGGNVPTAVRAQPLP